MITSLLHLQQSIPLSKVHLVPDELNSLHQNKAPTLTPGAALADRPHPLGTHHHKTDNVFPPTAAVYPCESAWQFVPQ